MDKCLPRQFGTLCVLLVLVPGVIWAQQNDEANGPTTSEAKPHLTTHVYNLDYLVESLPDYPLPAEEATPPGSARAAGVGDESNSNPDGLTVDSIQNLIVAHVDPTSWLLSGGADGTINKFNQSLLITQTPENRARIRQLLEDLRSDEDSCGVITVRAYWLNLSTDEMANITAMRKQNNAESIVPDVLLGGSHLYCNAQTTCYGGQTVHVTSERKSSYVSNLTPIVGSNAVAYQSTIAPITTGVRLGLMPMLTPGGDKVMINVDSTVTEAATSNAENPSPTTHESKPTPDRVGVLTQEFHTTARVPLSKNVLVGGMTLAPSADGQPARQLFLVINVEAAK